MPPIVLSAPSQPARPNRQTCPALTRLNGSARWGAPQENTNKRLCFGTTRLESTKQTRASQALAQLASPFLLPPPSPPAGPRFEERARATERREERRSEVEAGRGPPGIHFLGEGVCLSPLELKTD